MNKVRKDSAGSRATPDQFSPKRRSRREVLIKTGGLLAAGAFGAVPLRGWAADPINIGALYPTTGSMA
jgi:branched-chain amino acid transport system substrate-binding protein